MATAQIRPGLFQKCECGVRETCVGFRCIGFGFSRFGRKMHKVLTIVPVSDMLGALRGGNRDDFIVLEGLLHQV